MHIATRKTSAIQNTFKREDMPSKQEEPYYIHTFHGLEPVNAPRSKPSSSPPGSTEARTHNSNTASTLPPPHSSDAASTLSAPLINPKHGPEVCPPSPRSSKREKWHKLKEENAQRKSREVTRVSHDEAAALSGRDRRGFKTGDEDGWTEREKDHAAKRMWECAVM